MSKTSIGSLFFIIIPQVHEKCNCIKAQHPTDFHDKNKVPEYNKDGASAAIWSLKCVHVTSLGIPCIENASAYHG